MQNPYENPTAFDRLLAEKATEGWQYVGLEKLTQTQFGGTSKFEEVLVQTEADIKARLEKEGKEVELVLRPSAKMEELQKILTPEEMAKVELHDEDKSYFVFVRDKK